MNQETPLAANAPHWQLWIDTGGTFTDCLAIDPRGARHCVKVLSSSALRARLVERRGAEARLMAGWQAPAGFLVGCCLTVASCPQARATVLASRPDGWLRLDGALEGFAGASTVELRFELEAPVLAAHLVTATPPAEALPPLRLRLATTRGTNALLERRGQPPVLFITQGFGDLLRIGDQRRPDLFALAIERPPPLYDRVVEVAERLDAAGEVVRPLDLAALAEPVAAARAGGARTAAVALLNSYRNPVHEEALATYLRAAGFHQVATSAALVPTIKILPRAETAVVDAYLAPVIEGYLAGVASAIARGQVHVMTSAGGLMRAAAYRARDSLLSGPAGGVVGARAAAEAAGFERIIAFDMGGTSTDVSRIAGDFSYRFLHRVGDATVAAPALEIETVAAGGGSICWADGDRLRVGPQSAGADPGPACYGAGGPLTLTDVNLLLGRLDPARFTVPIDRRAARRALETLGQRLLAAGSEPGSDESLLAGALEIANERMADAMRRISVRRGFDPADHILVAFGGAGGQHACAVAEKLGITTILLPPAAGLLSAAGLGAAVLERFAVRQVLAPLEVCEAQLGRWLEALAHEARLALLGEGVPAQRVEVRIRRAALRLLGQEATIEVDLDPGPTSAAALRTRFDQRYRAIFGYPPPPRRVELVTLRVVASEHRARGARPAEPPAPRRAVSNASSRAFLGGRWQAVASYDLEQLVPGDCLLGPALVFDPHATLVVADGWSGAVSASAAVLLERLAHGRRRCEASPA